MLVSLHSSLESSSPLEKYVASQDLKIGMFVSDLDRPWIETPFLLQGFLIDDQSQITLLQQYCDTVVIDPRRSTGEHFAEPEKEQPTRIGASLNTARADAEARREGESFLRITREFRGKIHTRRLARAPSIQPGDGRSRLTSELRYTAPIVDDVLHTLNSVQKAIASGAAIDTERVGALVDDMATSVERNPDAVIWLTRLKRTDQYGYDHALSVSVHLMIFSRFAGLDREQTRRLGTVGLLQDIGKLRVNPKILSKPGPLDEHELALAREHVAHSVAILRKQPKHDPDLTAIVESHHERFDGSGYPSGLSKSAISLEAEMAGLVDTYCALIQDRPYRKAISNQAAMEQLNQMRNQAFRDALIDLFLQCIGLYPVGTLVELNSDEVAIVIQQNQVRRLQPKVLVLLAPDKSLDKFPRTLDLLMQPTMPTGERYRIARALPANSYGIDPREFYLG